MGTSSRSGAARKGAAPVHRFYSSQSWIEGAAEEQLIDVAGMAGVALVAAFPDLHPGKYGPVGAAILADRIYPQLIGNDIGCGMSLFALDLPHRKLRLEKAADKLRTLEGPWDGDAATRLKTAGLPTDLHCQALGTIGGGNHFCELQVVDGIGNPDNVKASGLAKGDLVLLVHSGSRSLGTAIFSTVIERFEGLDPECSGGMAYRDAHRQAVYWAKLNRILIAERAARALRCECHLLTDAPHNLIEEIPGGFLHRKGAAKADQALVPLAGSRDSYSHLLKPQTGNADALASLAHGSGRKYDRRSMTGRAGLTRSDREKLVRTSFGGLVVCEDRQLLIEEAPTAYKDPAQVVTDLQNAGLADPVATLKPLITFKKAMTKQAVFHVLKALGKEAKAAGLHLSLETHEVVRPGEPASALVTLSGVGADHFAKSWTGTIQWTCKSPFRPHHRRQNWFVGIFSVPETEVKDIAPEPNQLRIDTFRPGGPGGQHQNKTDSGVRITHLATGIAATSTDERSQHRNRQVALERLEARILLLQQEELAHQRSETNRLHQQLERGNPVKVFKGERFVEVT
eukprot:g1830.t1